MKIWIVVVLLPFLVVNPAMADQCDGDVIHKQCSEKYSPISQQNQFLQCTSAKHFECEKEQEVGSYGMLALMALIISVVIGGIMMDRRKKRTK